MAPRSAPLAALLALLAFAAPRAPARAAEDELGSVAATNGVVVHGVDTKRLASSLRDADRLLAEGQSEAAGKALAELLSGNLDGLVEEGDGVYLSGLEAARQRVAALPPEGRAGYLAVAGPRAAAALEAARRTRSRGALADDAARMALTEDGPRLLVALADRHLLAGDVDLAVRALEDLLRLWPEGRLPEPGRPAVLSRLAAALAAEGDAAAVLRLARETAGETLSAPSPGLAGRTVAQELELAVRSARAARRGPSGRPTGPDRELHLVGEVPLPGSARGGLPEEPREIPERPLPFRHGGEPALLARVSNRLATDARIVALAPPGPDEAARGGLRLLWSWPSPEELQAGFGGPPQGVFAPARAGDLAIFPWPAARDDFTGDGEGVRHGLVALSLAAEGRLEDVRGRGEGARGDPVPELATLSFVGQPLVVGDAVFTTLVRRAESGATQTHVARFDVLPRGAASRLRLRWLRHVADGSSMPPASFSSHERPASEQPLAVPADLAARAGRVFVCTNTGAVAALDARDGRVQWVETYVRFGPSTRQTVLETDPLSWRRVPVLVDGPLVHVAPRDANPLLSFRQAPHRARSLLVDSVPLHGTATAESPGQRVPSLDPDHVLGVEDGVAYVSGVVPAHEIPSLAPPGSPLWRLRLRARLAGEPAAFDTPAQIPELLPAGLAAVTRDAVLFPTPKAIYRVRLDDFDAAPQVLFRADIERDPSRSADRIGNLVPDGDRLWSVTPGRIVLLAPR